jgi:ribosomal-protein-alanine N-acetyltransferase
MALLDWMTDATGPVVEGEGVLLRPPRAGDYAAWSDLRAQSRDYLQPWEPAWPDDDLTRAAYRRRLGVYAREMELGHAWPFFILDPRGRTLHGAITLSNVRRGVAETGTLGYWIGQPYAGRGLATAAVRATAGFAFRSARLHRLEASCLPANVASRRVLEKAGFRKEGEARAYLKINGAWADHVLFGLVSDELQHP